MTDWTLTGSTEPAPKPVDENDGALSTDGDYCPPHLIVGPTGPLNMKRGHRAKLIEWYTGPSEPAPVHERKAEAANTP